MGGTELSEIEKAEAAEAQINGLLQKGLNNATRGTILNEERDRPTDSGLAGNITNGYAGSAALNPNQEVDYDLGGPKGLATKLNELALNGTNEAIGGLSPNQLEGYITQNLNLDDPEKEKKARVDLLIALAESPTGSQLKADIRSRASEIQSASEERKLEIYDELLHQHLKRMVASMPASRFNSEKDARMASIIDDYFSPDRNLRIDTSRDPKDIAEKIVCSIYSTDAALTPEKRAELISVVDRLPFALREPVKAELLAMDDMATTSARELHSGLNSGDPASMVRVLIGKTRGNPVAGDVDQIAYIASKYEEVHGKSFNQALRDAEEAGKITKEDREFIEGLMKTGFDPDAIAAVLRDEINTIRTSGNVTDGSKALIAGVATIGTYLNANKTFTDKDGVLRRQGPKLWGLTGGLAAAYGAERAEHAYNKAHYALMKRAIDGLSAEQLGVVQERYSGKGGLEQIADDMKSLDFLTASNRPPLNSEQKEALAKEAVEAMRNLPTDQAAAKVASIYSRLKASEARDVTEIADRITESTREPIMVPKLDDKGNPEVDPTTKKPVMIPQKNADGSLVYPAGEATTFSTLLINTFGSNETMYESLRIRTQGFNASHRVREVISLVGRTRAFLNPEEATQEEKQELRRIMRDDTAGLDAAQLREYKEEWKKQLGEGSKLTDDFAEYVRDPATHTQLTVLMKGTSKPWDNPMENYASQPEPDSNPLTRLGITPKKGVFGVIEQLHTSLHQDNSPANTQAALERLRDEELGAIDNLVMAFRGEFDGPKFQQHIQGTDHEKAIELAYNPWTRAERLKSLIETGTNQEVEAFLEQVGGPIDATNPKQGQKVDLFLDVYGGQAHLASQLREKHPEVLKGIPEVLKGIIERSNNRALQLEMKSAIKPEITASLKNSATDVDKRVDIAERFYGRQLVEQGITDRQVVKDLITAVDIATSDTLTPEQQAVFSQILTKGAADGGQITSTFGITFGDNAEILGQVTERSVFVRYQMMQDRLKELGIELKVDGEPVTSEVVTTGEERGNVQVKGKKGAVLPINNEKMAKLEELTKIIEETLAKEPGRKEEAEKALEMGLKRD